jgi:hypothetical protein
MGSWSNTNFRIPAKHAHEDSDPESDSDDMESDTDRMDFQHCKNITATQAIGDVNDNPGCHGISRLPPPLSAENAILCSHFETITLAAIGRLYTQIISDLQKSAADTAEAFQRTTDQLQDQITSMGTQITQLQQ